MSKAASTEAIDLPILLVYTARERARAFVRGVFSRRKWKIVTVRDVKEFRESFRNLLVDAAIVDIGSPWAAANAGGEATGAGSFIPGTAHDDSWKIMALAHEFPSAPFFAVSRYRATDAPAIARAASLECSDILADGLDDTAARDLVASRTFSSRFAAALREPPAPLGLRTEMQLATWRLIIAGAGKPVRTASLAREAGVSREHLSRHFSAPRSPNMKRVIDLVRMIGAAELAKNPGLDIRDVARILGFASSSHLAVTAQRVLGVRPASLSRLRTVDLIDRFTQGRTRSRA